MTRVYDAELLGPDVSPDDPGYPCMCGRQAVPVLVDCKVVGQHHHIRCPRQPVNGWQALWRGNHIELCGPMKVQWK